MNGKPQALLYDFKDDVKAWVPKVRDVLDKDFTAELKRLGIPTTGKPIPLEKMNLPETDVRVRTRVEALLHRDSLLEGSEQKGYENVRRELSYTCLNRLVGLKCMEARGLLYLPPPDNPHDPPEPTEVVTYVLGQARSRFLRDLRATGGSRYKYGDGAEPALLRDGLTAAYRFITSEIRILFDPDHEYACLWPTHASLVKVIETINNDLPEGAYRAHDFLGWVYQFFNREEKEKVKATLHRESGGAPRTSYELSVTNQFYTPSWVVKALVDNTLGRLWLQMHPDSSLRPTQLPSWPHVSDCRGLLADYLVPNTGENLRFEQIGEDGEVTTYKLAAQISLLDPACGTMHFGQYAFGLFHEMYLDEIRHAGEPGWPSEPSITDSKAIPAAIIQNNLFGIDIDARAVQIASLSLLLTAKEAAVRGGFSPLEVNVRRTQLVVANAVDIGEQQLRSLVGSLSDRLGSRNLREELFKAVWENLKHVGEMGSLVQVRESVSRVLDDWVDRQAQSKGMTAIHTAKESDQLQLGTIARDWELERKSQMELERGLLEQEVVQIRLELLTGLEEIAQTEGDPTQRLFAEDTARGLKLLDILSRRYDAVVMNPPYGSPTSGARDLLKAMYPLTWNDIYATFIDRGTQLIEPYGYVGALVSSTFVNLASFENLRTQILLARNPLVVMLDLGRGILDDANVATAALVIRGAA